MFLCRINPRAFRVRPSQGDGGIDVCVPTSPGHWEVYQVKRFAENLKSGQKKQAEGSHKRLREYVRSTSTSHAREPFDPYLSHLPTTD